MNIKAIRELTAQIEADPEKELGDEWKRTHAAYLSVFGTAKGEFVLADILRDLHFMEVATDPAHVVLQNFAAVLLRKLGVNTEEQRTKLTSSLLKLARMTSAAESKED